MGLMVDSLLGFGKEEIMLFEDKEALLLEDFRSRAKFNDDSIFLMSDTEEIRKIIESIVDDVSWSLEWVDSSSKGDPPPDFYNNSKQLMMEVMRVDDHSFEQDGRIHNPTNKRAREIEKELRRNGVFDISPDVPLFVNAPTDLPYAMDHNYRFYKENFRRVVVKHGRHACQYRKNHPGYKLIFFVYDESSIYCKTDIPNRTVKKGERMKGYPHFWFFDKAFIDVVKKSEIDYLIWYAPYKLYLLMDCPFKMPATCVIDCKNMSDETTEYPEDYMISLEE